MNIVLSDTAMSKAGRYLSSCGVKHAIKNKEWRPNGDGLYKVYDSNTSTKIIILFDYYEEEDKVVVITQKCSAHDN